MKKINVIDIGCRYGVFDLFKKNIQNINYYGIDADEKEIKRLKKKFYSKKNIKFFHGCLDDNSSKKIFNEYEHKGYNSTKEINEKSFWFQVLRKKEKKIISKKLLKFIKSETFFIKHKIPIKHILKLDVEGQELEIIKGFKNSISDFKAIIFEGHFDKPYKNASNFSEIEIELSKNNFFIAKIDIEKNLLSQYSTNNFNDEQGVPTGSNVIMLNKKYFNPKSIDSNCLDILYLLNLFDLLLFFLEKNITLINKCFFKRDIHINIGKMLNKKLKEIGANKSRILKLYKKIFKKKLPQKNKFNESNFFNAS